MRWPWSERLQPPSTGTPAHQCLHVLTHHTIDLYAVRAEIFASFDTCSYKRTFFLCKIFHCWFGDLYHASLRIKFNSVSTLQAFGEISRDTPIIIAVPSVSTVRRFHCIPTRFSRHTTGTRSLGNAHPPTRSHPPTPAHLHTSQSSSLDSIPKKGLLSYHALRRLFWLGPASNKRTELWQAVSFQIDISGEVHLLGFSQREFF